MTYKALDVANYVVNYCIEEKKPISNLKLQKMLYYIQAAFLVEEDQKAFKEPISAWKYGPVVESVYRSFRRYVDRDIVDKVDFKAEGLFGKNINNKYDPNKVIEDSHQQLMNKIIDAYIGCSAMELVEKTHQEDPWRDAFEEDMLGIEIETRDIKRYYKKKKEKLYA